MSINYTYQDFLGDNSNISGRNRSELCAMAYSFRQETLLIFILFILASLNALTLITLYLVYKNREVRRTLSLIHLDLKLILILWFSAYVVASLDSFAFFAYQVVILLIDLSPCSYLISGYFCFYAQIAFTSFCPAICLLLFFAMFLERFYTSIGLSSNGTFGFILCFFTMVISILSLPMIFNSSTYESERIFCGSAITVFDPNVTSAAYLSIIFDFAITLMDFFLLIFNRRKMQAYK
jgi:hypothetical protein